MKKDAYELQDRDDLRLATAIQSQLYPVYLQQSYDGAQQVSSILDQYKVIGKKDCPIYVIIVKDEIQSTPDPDQTPTKKPAKKKAAVQEPKVKAKPKAKAKAAVQGSKIKAEPASRKRPVSSLEDTEEQDIKKEEDFPNSEELFVQEEDGVAY
ncbi:hypothetical protein BDW72DRAFT_199982, partial [Aspergillus terricola var. indicus]